MTDLVMLTSMDAPVIYNSLEITALNMSCIVILLTILLLPPASFEKKVTQIKCMHGQYSVIISLATPLLFCIKCFLETPHCWEFCTIVFAAFPECVGL